MIVPPATWSILTRNCLTPGTKSKACLKLWPWCSPLQSTLTCTSLELCELRKLTGVLINPVLQMEKLGLKEIVGLARDNTAPKWQRQQQQHPSLLNPGGSPPQQQRAWTVSLCGVRRRGNQGRAGKVLQNLKLGKGGQKRRGAALSQPLWALAHPTREQEQGEDLLRPQEVAGSLMRASDSMYPCRTQSQMQQQRDKERRLSLHHPLDSVPLAIHVFFPSTQGP